MLLEPDGRVAGFAAQPRADDAVRSELPTSMMKRMLRDTTLQVGISGVAARVQPSHTVIVWGVRR